MPNYTREQLDGIVKELGGGQLLLVCQKHNYTASKIPPPPRGCADCLNAYFVWDYATTPPHLRKERLEELESIIKHAVEFDVKGKFGKDFELFNPGDPRFKVSYEKDGE